MTVHYADDQVTLHHGDALEICRQLDSGAADCIVTSPPYFGLRDYGVPGQYGAEATPAAYVETMRALFAELWRVLADDGTLWLNIGDSYYSGKGSPTQPDAKNGARRPPARILDKPGADWARPKQLIGIPWRVALAMQADGWILRNAIVWQKPNAMPESVKDRLTGRYEHVFLFSKQQRYWFDVDAIKVEYQGDRTPSRGAHKRGNKENTITNAWDGNQHQGRNPGDVWVIPTQPFPAAHFAVMPVALAQHCVIAGCRPGGTVLDPFSGSGTTGLAAQRVGRRYVGIDLNAEYLDLSLRTRLHAQALDFQEGSV